MTQASDDTPKNPRRPGETVGRVVRALTQSIREKRYGPGEKLTEQVLVKELSVSRGTLREAFRRLAAERLIEILPNRGAVVRRMTKQQALELLVIRTELAALAAKLATERLGSGCERVEFEKAIEPIWDDAVRSDPMLYIEENRRFHTAIWKACGNEELILLARRLQLPLIIVQIAGELHEHDLKRSVEQHRAVAKAILAGDATAAAEATRAHVRTVIELVRNMPDNVFWSGPTAHPADVLETLL